MAIWPDIYLQHFKKTNNNRTLLPEGPEGYLKKEYIRVNPQSNEELKLGTPLKFWSHGELKH